MLAAPPAVAEPYPAAATLCVHRPYQQGRLNIDPVTLTIRQGSFLRRFRFDEGGLRRCTRLRPGKANVAIRFVYPYGGIDEPGRYWSTRSAVRIVRGPNRWILDASPTGFGNKSPHWDETGWQQTWSLWQTDRPDTWRPTTRALKPNRGAILILGRP